MALVGTGVETSIIYGDQTKFSGDRVMIHGFGEQTFQLPKCGWNWGLGISRPGNINHLLPQSQSTSWAWMLYGVWFSRQLCESSDWQRWISVQAVQAILRAHVKHEPICLPKPHQITNVRQYRILGGQDETSSTVQELDKVGIIRPAHSPYNSPIWLVWKLDGTRRMTVDYRELNKVTPLYPILPP